MSTKITVNNHGSLRIEGEVELYDGAGNKYGLGGRQVFSLCRCGQSNNKPFCDGTHKSIGFQSSCYAKELPPLDKK